MKNFSNNGLGNRPEAGELGDGRTGAVRVERGRRRYLTWRLLYGRKHQGQEEVVA